MVLFLYRYDTIGEAGKHGVTNRQERAANPRVAHIARHNSGKRR